VTIRHPPRGALSSRMMVTDLSLNLADPQEVRAKMPEIRALLAEARQELRALEDQVELLARIVGENPPASLVRETSRGRSAPGRGRKPPKRRQTQKAAPSQERAVQALERAGCPMGPADLFRFMEARGMDRPTTVSALNALLWAASKKGRVVKAPGNVYEPPGGFPAHAANGMAVSAQLPGPNGYGSPTAALQTSPQSLSQGGGGRPRESEEE
jgi:hypothetical protein